MNFSHCQRTCCVLKINSNRDITFRENENFSWDLVDEGKHLVLTKTLAYFYQISHSDISFY